MEDNTAVTAYFTCINDNYNNIKHICHQLCIKNKETFSEDILNDTVIQIHKIIKKKGQLNDMSCSGITNYFVRSYVNNLRCEKRYAVNAKRDLNIKQESIQDLYEEYSNKKSTTREKIIKDLYIDFSILYIMKMVELNFDAEHFYLYRLKTLCGKTYKQVHDETKIKKSREKILEVSKWVKQNISREQIKNEFYSIYSELVDY